MRGASGARLMEAGKKIVLSVVAVALLLVAGWWFDHAPVVRASQQQAPSEDATARRQALAADSAALLQLANELKTEVDKTNKDILSVTAVRKADAVEKAAHQLRLHVRLVADAD